MTNAIGPVRIWEILRECLYSVGKETLDGLEISAEGILKEDTFEKLGFTSEKIDKLLGLLLEEKKLVVDLGKAQLSGFKGVGDLFEHLKDSERDSE